MTMTQTPSHEIPTPTQVATNPFLFAKTFLKIQDKHDKIIPLHYRDLQMMYLNNRTRRDLILKPRQVGFSTAIQAEIFRYSTTRPMRSLTLADKDDNTKNFRLMQEKFYNNLPENFRPKRKLANDIITTYPEFNSEVRIATAGGKGGAGRSSTVRIIHGSEVAFWTDAQSIVSSALQAGEPFWVVFESTPNGARGWFYEQCKRALDGDKTWHLHIYHWFDSPLYSMALEQDETISYTDEERALVKRYSLTAEQIKWRRSKISLMGDDFFQEYLEDVDTCFKQSGEGVFTNISAVLYDSTSAITTPIEGHKYVMGVDWGQADDYTAVSIFDVNDMCEVVLERMRNQSWGDMRDRIVRLAKHWQVGSIYPEANSIGGVNIEQLNNALVDTTIRVRPFMMSQTRKQHLVSLFKEGIEKQEFWLLDHSYATSELRSFESKQTANGAWSYAHPVGGHDDTVDARMLAWFGVGRAGNE